MFKNLSLILWSRLLAEKQYQLIDRLHKAEIREGGYTTVVVPKEGFSVCDITHNLVIDWLSKRPFINVVNIRKEIHELKQSCSWKRRIYAH